MQSLELVPIFVGAATRHFCVVFSLNECASMEWDLFEIDGCWCEMWWETEAVLERVVL